jgi:hypothetical protein
MNSQHALNKEPIAAVIRFKKDYSVTLVKAPDRKTGIAQERDEFFHAGQEHEIAVFNDFGEYVNLAFGDGSELYGLKKEDFEVVRISPVE